MIRILPMSEPIIKCYPIHAGVFSILGAHTQEHLPWVYNFYVQIFTPPGLKYKNRLNYAVLDPLKVCPWIETIHLERSIGLEVMNIVELIKTCINHEYYFFSCFNVNQIAAYEATQLSNHEMLIYGYNDEKEEFYFADNYKKGKYSHGIASYKEIENATGLFGASKERLALIGIKYVEDNKLKYYQFDKRAYTDLLVDYIEQRDNSRYWDSPGIVVKTYQERKWGIGVYSFVLDYLTLAQKAGKSIDIRGFYVIKEHKLILEKSLTYVLGTQWKSKYPTTWNLLEKDIKMATVALNLCLKYNLVFNEKLFDKIRQYIMELEENDRRLFPSLIEILEGK